MKTIYGCNHIRLAVDQIDDSLPGYDRQCLCLEALVIRESRPPRWNYDALGPDR